MKWTLWSRPYGPPLDWRAADGSSSTGPIGSRSRAIRCAIPKVAGYLFPLQRPRLAMRTTLDIEADVFWPPPKS